MQWVRNTNKNQTVRRSVVFIFIALMLVGVSVYNVTAPPALLRPEKITTANVHGAYAWMSGNDRLFTLNSINGLTQVTCIDVKNGYVIHYPFVERFLAQWKVFPSRHMFSPDGRQILLLIGSAKKGRAGTIDLEAGQWLPARKQEYPLGWLNDSQHWIGAIEKNKSWYMILHDCHDRASIGIEIGQQPSGKFLGCTSIGSLLFIRREAADSNVVVMTEWALLSKNHEHHYEVCSPIGTEPLDVALSTRGDYLAWQFRTVKSALAKWIDQEIRSNTKALEFDDLWVSRWNGMAMRELGRIEVHRPDTFDGPTGSDLEHITWTNNDNRISFLYKGGIYAIAAVKQR